MGKDPACTSYSLFPIIHAAGHRLQQGGGAPTSDPRVLRHAKRKMIFPAVSRPLTAAFFSRASAPYLDACCGEALLSHKFSREEMVCTKTLYNYVTYYARPYCSSDKGTNENARLDFCGGMMLLLQHHSPLIVAIIQINKIISTIGKNQEEAGWEETI